MSQEGFRSKRKYKVGCLFAAIGGFCKAFEMAGAQIAWANEKDKFAKEGARDLRAT
jgi:site-specific DNA-cytosine methylase